MRRSRQRALRALAVSAVLASTMTMMTACGESVAQEPRKAVVQSYQVKGAGLAIEIERPSGVLTPGNDLAYRIDVRNTGDRAYKNLLVNQLLPGGLAYWRAKPSPTIENRDQLRWALDLPPGAAKRLLVRGRVTEKATKLPWSAAMAMASLSGDGAPLSTTACVSPNAASRITGCTTAVNRVLPNTPWFATGWAILAYVILLGGLVAGYIFWYRPRRARTSSP